MQKSRPAVQQVSICSFRMATTNALLHSADCNCWCANVTANMAKVAEARRAARASRSAALREIEGDQAYDGQQEFLAVAARVAREGRLSRFVYVSKKLN